RHSATTTLAAEVRRIAALLRGVEAERAREAVVELLVAFDVYRSYLPEGREAWDRAVDRAARRRPDLAGVLRRVDTEARADPRGELARRDRKSTRLNSSHVKISYAVF